MKHITFLYGKLKAFYLGVWPEYVIYKKRKRLLLKMSYELHNLGFYIKNDGTTLYRQYYINDERFKGKLKMLALKTDSNRFILRDEGVYLVRDYEYLNIESISRYIVIPLVIAIGLLMYVL